MKSTYFFSSPIFLAFLMISTTWKGGFNFEFIQRRSEIFLVQMNAFFGIVHFCICVKPGPQLSRCYFLLSFPFWMVLFSVFRWTTMMLYPWTRTFVIETWKPYKAVLLFEFIFGPRYLSLLKTESLDNAILELWLA